MSFESINEQGVSHAATWTTEHRATSVAVLTPEAVPLNRTRPPPRGVAVATDGRGEFYQTWTTRRTRVNSRKPVVNLFYLSWIFLLFIIFFFMIYGSDRIMDFRRRSRPWLCTIGGEARGCGGPFYYNSGLDAVRNSEPRFIPTKIHWVTARRVRVVLMSYNKTKPFRL